MRTHSVMETRAIGEKLAQKLHPGDVLLLYGDLGAGKSELTRGIARGLHVEEPVTSPTFTILNVYESGTVPLYHFDWYRLNSAEELWEMGMEEYLGGDGIAIVEWPTRCPEAIPADYLELTIHVIDENTREIVTRPVGNFRPVILEEFKA